MTARTSPVPTESPAATRISLTVPARLGVDVVLHLHRLEHEDRLADLDRRARPRRAPARSCPASARCTVPSPPPVPELVATRFGPRPAPARRPRSRRAPRGATPAPRSGGRRPRPAPSARRAAPRAPSPVGRAAGAGARPAPRTATGRPRPRPTWSSGATARKSAWSSNTLCAGMVVRTPSISNSSSARSMRSMARSRSGAHTISLPTRLS